VTDRTVIFLHLPKAAGSTLNRVIAQQYSPEEIYKTSGKPPQVLASEIAGKKPRLIAGHQPFGLHALMAGPSTYITILREPAERMISHYHYARKLSRHEMHGEIAGGLSLRDAAHRMANLQTRYLADESVRGTGETAGREALESAKENLASHFAVAGVAECFEESLVLLQRRLGWRVRPVASSNVTRGKKSPHSEADLALIREVNALDRELYDWARARFEAEIAKEGKSFRSAVRWLRFRNRALHLRDSLMAKLKSKA
jgi:hypothetical protein